MMWHRRGWRPTAVVWLLAVGCGGMVGGSVTDASDGSVPTPDGLTPDASPDGGIAKLLRLDSCGDFSDNDSRLASAVLETWGAIGPAPQLTEVVVARGANTALFSDPNRVDWNDLVRARVSGVGVTALEPLTLM